MRNMIDANTKAFERLNMQLQAKATPAIPPGRKWFKTSELEKKWLKQCKIESVIHPLPSLQGLLVSFESEWYVFITGQELSAKNTDPNVLNECDLNSGMVTVLIGENYLRLSNSANGLEFYDNIASQHLDKQYQGHDFQEVLPYLEPIVAISLPQNSIFYDKPDLNRILTYVYSCNGNALFLNFNTEVLKTFADVSLVGSNSISFALMLNCLFSTNFKHAFLELYRLVERLFPIGYLKTFYKQAGASISFQEFCSSLEEITSWRPNEDKAIERIFLSTSQSTTRHFDRFRATLPQLRDVSSEKYFYKLRNSIVHFRANHEEFTLTAEQWNLLLLATLYLIDDHYSAHASVIQ